MKKNNYLIGLIISGCVLSQVAKSDGIPIADIAGFLQRAQQYSKQAQDFQQTLEHYKETIAMQKETLATLNGVRNVGGFLNAINTVLQKTKDLDSWLNDPTKILDSGTGILNNAVKRVFDSYNMLNSCKIYKDKEDLNLCTGKIIITAVQQVQNERNAQEMGAHIEKVTQIAQKMQSSHDLKESEDLNNTIQAEMASMKALQIRMQMEDRRQAQLERLIKQKEHDRQMKAMTNTANFTF